MFINIDVSKTIMSIVLDTTKYVVKNAKYVKINKENIDEFCKNFERSHINHWINEAPFDIEQLNDKDKLNFLLVFNTLSFSYWGDPKWTVEYKGEKFDGAWGMIVALGKAIEARLPILDISWLSSISNEDFSKIIKGNIEIPLFEERVENLREIGQIITAKFNGDFSNMIINAKNDALKLLDVIVTTFPSFQDIRIYQGKTIYFHKRAQLLISDIYQLFRGKKYGNLKNINKLTACADYKLPMVLRRLGILKYTKELAQKVDNKVNIPEGSEEEVEIRAATIWANELIKQQLKKKIKNIDSIHINDHLWLLGQNKLPADKPYHLTRTTAY